MAISQIHLIIPIVIGIFYLEKTYFYEKASHLIGMRSFDYGIVFFCLILPLAAESFAGWMVTPFIETLTEMFGEQVDFDEIKTVGEFLWLFVSLCLIAPIIAVIKGFANTLSPPLYFSVV